MECDIPNEKITVNGGDPQVMLAALMKWSNASGKSVELISP